jgi:hypothetical protein
MNAKLCASTGDRIRWTANDKARGLFNSAAADVVSITREGVEVRTSEGVNMLLPHGDRMLSRLGLAYAINMHQAQGMTTDQGIGVMHSAERHLSNQRLTHVMATRVRDDLAIYTNDRDALLRSIDANAGDKASALEHVGPQAKQAHSPSSVRSPRSTAPAPPTDRDEVYVFDTESREARAKQNLDPAPALTHVPEKSIELGL